MLAVLNVNHQEQSMLVHIFIKVHTLGKSYKQDYASAKTVHKNHLAYKRSYVQGNMQRYNHAIVLRLHLFKGIFLF